MGFLRRPVGRGALCLFRLTGKYDQLSALDIWIEDIHCAAKEEVDIVVVRRAGEQFNVEGSFRIVQIKRILDIVALNGADLIIIKVA